MKDFGFGFVFCFGFFFHFSFGISFSLLMFILDLVLVLIDLLCFIHYLNLLISADDATENVYFNTSVPFCAIALGVQGAGKSYTVSTLVGTNYRFAFIV
jgi:hypothetical protein